MVVVSKDEALLSAVAELAGKPAQFTRTLSLTRLAVWLTETVAPLPTAVAATVVDPASAPPAAATPVVAPAAATPAVAPTNAAAPPAPSTTTAPSQAARRTVVGRLTVLLAGWRRRRGQDLAPQAGLVALEVAPSGAKPYLAKVLCTDASVQTKPAEPKIWSASVVGK